METQAETCITDTRRVIKWSVPQDYEETHKQVTRRENKRTKTLNTYKEVHLNVIIVEEIIFFKQMKR